MIDHDLADVAAFVAVVDGGGFSSAARNLRQPKSSLSRQVARLESRLGTRLLERTTRSIALTEAGRKYYDRVSTGISLLHEAADIAFEAREIARGTVRVAAPPDVGSEVLPALIAAFLLEYPEVAVDLQLTGDAIDLVSSGHDIALRSGRPSDKSLEVWQLQETAMRLYASPDYLQRAGSPAMPEELSTHACVLFRSPRGTATWDLVKGDRHCSIPVAGRLNANDMATLRRAAENGVGICLLPEALGRVAVMTGALTALLPEWSGDAKPLVLVHAAHRHLPLRTRAFRDFILARFPK